MTNDSTRTTTRSRITSAEAKPAPQIVQVSLMDTYVPSIPEINPDNAKLSFPYQQHTKIEGDQEYKQMCIVHKKCYRNTLSIKSSFGGGKRGHKKSVTKPAIYRITTCNNWIVTSMGVFYPMFRDNVTKNSKNQTIADFISCETNIKMPEVVEEQLKNQLLGSFPEAFNLELCEGSRQ